MHVCTCTATWAVPYSSSLNESTESSGQK
jgi:hypothetical protein